MGEQALDLAVGEGDADGAQGVGQVAAADARDAGLVLLEDLVGRGTGKGTGERYVG